MDVRAVSEVIGTILMLAVTTVLVGAVAIWAGTLGDSGEEVQVDFLANIEYDGANDIYYITHQGGESLDESDITIHLKYAPAANPDSFMGILTSPYQPKESQNHVGQPMGTNGFWETGETFSILSPTTYSQTGIVLMQVIYQTPDDEIVLLRAEFDKSSSIGDLPDLSIERVRVLDPEGNGHLIDESPMVEIEVWNIGDAPSTPVPVGDVTIMVFDGERYMGTAKFGPSVTQLSPDPGMSGTPYYAYLNTSDLATYPSAYEWSQEQWKYTGRHTVNAKILPLDEEKKYSNNYANVIAGVTLDFLGELYSGPDPEVHESFISISNRAPKTGETVTITIFIKNKGDENLVGTANESEQVWFVISTQPIIRSGAARNIFNWQSDDNDDDSGMNESQPTCVRKNLSIPSAGQIQYTFSWVASADYPGQVRNIYFGVDVNHFNSTTDPGTVDEAITYQQGDDQDNNYGWIPIQVMPKVLVIDDDGVETGDADDVASRVLEGLVGSGISVDGLVKATDDFPKYNDEGMEQFEIIIWVTGRATDPLTTTNSDELKKAMDDGKYVWIIGNNVLDNMYTSTPTMASPTLLSGGAGNVHTYNPATSTLDDLAYNYFGISTFSTGVNPITDQNLTILDQSTIPFTLTDWMDGQTEYVSDYSGSEDMEIIQSRVSPPYADSREISPVIRPGSTSGTYYNSIGVRVPDGYRAVVTAFDFASLRSLNEEINITTTVLRWFNWQMTIGDDLALTDLRIEPSNPKFMETVNLTVIARNNGINLKINSILFYVTGEDGIERQIPTYGTDTNPVEVRIGGGGQVTISKEWLATETGLHTFRAMIDPYYILPEISETNNDLAYSVSTSSTSLIQQSVLIIDDDSGTASTNMIENSINALGYYNDVWDASASTPTVDDMKMYNTVIWNTGSGAGHILDGSVDGVQDQIRYYLEGDYDEAKYLDRHNETFWLMGNGYVSGTGTYGSGNFFHDLFGVGFYNDNAVSSSSNLVGLTDNIISHGIDYPRVGFGIRDDRINKATTLSADDELEEVYYGGSEASANCLGISHHNNLDYYNTLISTYDVIDIVIPGIAPEKDSVLYGSLPNNGYGASDKLRIGRISDLNQRAPVLKWDLSEIPSTATIDSATLKFYTTGMLGATAISRVNVYPLQDNAVAGGGATWSEGPHTGEAATDGATWRHFDRSLGGSGLWTGNVVRLPNSGAGLQPSLKTSTLNLPTASQAVNVDVRNMVQNWVDGTQENEGLVLTLWSEILSERATGENEIYSREYSDSQMWPTLIISYTDGGVGGQSPVGRENAVAEMEYLGLHWLALDQKRPDFRATNIDVSINDPNPQLGYSYIISADIQNVGDGTGACTVRFLDGETLVKSSTVYLTGGESVTEEAIWVPLYAGSGHVDEYRDISIQLDPLDKVEEVFNAFNNGPSTSVPVYFLYDDFEYDNQVAAEQNWAHEATVVNINGESTLDFLEEADTNIISEFANYSLEQTKWVQNSAVSHSVNTSFSIKEPIGGTSVTGADLLLGLVIDDSRSMWSRTAADPGTTFDYDGDGYVSPLDKAKEASVYLLDQLSDESMVAVYHFQGSNAVRGSDLTQLDTGGRPNVYSNVTGLTNPSGQTIIWDAIGLAFSEIQDNASKFPQLTPTIVVLSDGADYRSSDTSAPQVGKIESSSSSWCPWHNMSSGAVTYTSHRGKYSLPYSAIPGTWYTSTFSATPRMGLLEADFPIYTIGLALEHHDPVGTPTKAIWAEGVSDNIARFTGAPESGTVEYNLWRIANTSGAEYFYAPTSTELRDIFTELARILAGAGTTRGGSYSAPEAEEAEAVRAGSRALITIFEDTFSGGTDTSWLGDDGGETAPSDEWWDVRETSDLNDIQVTSYNGQTGLLFQDCDAGFGSQYAEGMYNGGNNWFDLTDYDSGNIYYDNTGTGLDSANYEGWLLQVTRNGGGSWFTVAQQRAGLVGNPNHVWRTYGYSLSAADLASTQWGFRFNVYSNLDGEIVCFDNVRVVVNLPDDIYEENDFIGASYNLGDLTASGLMTYDCAMMDGGDYYAITNVGMGDTILVNLDFQHWQGDINVRLIAPDMTTYVASSLSTTDDEGISYPVGIPGTYYIRVYRLGPSISKYEMSILISLGDSGGTLRNPRNPYPSDGSTYVWMHPVLKWTGGDPAVVDHYGLWMGTRQGLESRIMDPDTGLPLKIYSDYHDPGVLVPNKVYYWYVIAYDQDNEALANKMDSRDYVLNPGPPVEYADTWSFTVEGIGGISQGDPADYELNALDTKAFRLTDAMSARMTFYHKFDLAPTINGAFLQLGVKYQGGTTEADIENPANYRYYYIIPEETYNSNMYLGNESFERPFLAYEGSDFNIEAPVNAQTDYNGDGDSTDPGENRALWCWNGKSSGGLFDWQQSSVNILDQIAAIEGYSTASIDPDNDYFKLRFSFFYFGAGNGGGWWVDDVKVLMSNGGTPAATSQDVWQFVKDSNRANSGTGCFWNGNPSNQKMMQAGIDNSLMTNAIDLTRAIDVTFSAYFAYNINTAPGIPPDCLRIELSDDGGSTWKAINYGVRSFAGTSGVTATPSGSYKATSSEPRINIDLSAWAGNVIYLRFRVVTTSNATYAHNENNALNWGGLYIDDITVSGNSITGSRASPSEGSARAIDPAPEQAVPPDEQVQKNNAGSLEAALLNCDGRILLEMKDAQMPAFIIPVPVGTGFIPALLDEREEDPLAREPAPAEDKELKDYLSVASATKREAEPAQGADSVYNINFINRREIE